MNNKITYIEEEGYKYLIYETDNVKNRNNIAINVTSNETVPHLITAYYDYDKGIKAEYDITDYLPIMSIFSNYAGRDEVYQVLKKILFVMIELENSFICEPDIILKKEYIYYDKNSDLVKFIAAPVVLGEDNTIRSLFSDILSSVQWKRNENKSYLNVLAKALSDNKSYQELIEVIVNILSKPVEYIPVESTAQMQNNLKNNKEDKKEVIINEAPIQQEQGETQTIKSVQQEQSVSVPPVQPAPIPPVQPAPVPPVQPAPVPPVQSVPIPPVQPAPIPPVQPAPIPPVQPATIPPIQPAPVSQQQVLPTVTMETAVLNEDSYGQTTVLGVSSQLSIYPSLVRMKNNEKIVINKNEFVIGKEPSKVDYCIFDNPAVSRIHARILSKNGEFFVRDNNSTNRVYVNGMLIDPNCDVRLSHNSRVRLGDEDFEFKFQ